jgi:hypothetical protein
MPMRLVTLIATSGSETFVKCVSVNIRLIHFLLRMGVQQDALLSLFFTFELEHTIREDQENQKG